MTSQSPGPAESSKEPPQSTNTNFTVDKISKAKTAKAPFKSPTARLSQGTASACPTTERSPDKRMEHVSQGPHDGSLTHRSASKPRHMQGQAVQYYLCCLKRSDKPADEQSAFHFHELYPNSQNKAID